jgi:5-methylcytosine-specific restriction protein A
MGKGKKHYSRPNTCKRGYDRQWRKVRLAYLQCNPLCEQCLKEGITTPALDVDHIVPLSKGGERLDFDNLQALCRRCHNKKTHGKGNQ